MKYIWLCAFAILFSMSALAQEKKEDKNKEFAETVEIPQEEPIVDNAPPEENILETPFYQKVFGSIFEQMNRQRTYQVKCHVTMSNTLQGKAPEEMSAMLYVRRMQNDQSRLLWVQEDGKVILMDHDATYMIFRNSKTAFRFHHKDKSRFFAQMPFLFGWTSQMASDVQMIHLSVPVGLENNGDVSLYSDKDKVTKAPVETDEHREIKKIVIEKLRKSPDYKEGEIEIAEIEEVKSDSEEDKSKEERVKIPKNLPAPPDNVVYSSDKPARMVEPEIVAVETSVEKHFADLTSANEYVLQYAPHGEQGAYRDNLVRLTLFIDKDKFMISQLRLEEQDGSQTTIILGERHELTNRSDDFFSQTLEGMSIQ